MSTVSNEGFMMQCKAVTVIMFTVVDPRNKPNRTAIAVPETPIQKYLSIR